MISSIAILHSESNISHFFAHILKVFSFLNELEVICLHTSIAITSAVKCFQLLLSNTNNSVQY